jgi:hypothetical protein
MFIFFCAHCAHSELVEELKRSNTFSQQAQDERWKYRAKESFFY